MDKAPQSASLASQFLEEVVRLSPTQNIQKHLTKENIKLAFSKRPMTYDMTQVYMLCPVEKNTLGSLTYYSWGALKEEAQCIIIYLHGGGYILQPKLPHFLLLNELTEALKENCHFVFPIYPKAPDYQFEEAYQKLLALYEKYLTEVGKRKFIFMGDSAGATLALGLCYAAQAGKLPSPHRLEVYSPWLDLKNRHLQQEKEAEQDVLLNLHSMRLAGELWLGSGQADDPRVSPLFADPELLPPVDLFVGTHDLLFPDVCQYAKKLAAAQKLASFTKAPKGPHDYALLPTPEGILARQKTIDQVQKMLKKA